MLGQTRQYIADKIGLFVQNQKGAALIEYAFALPIFLSMMIGGMEVGRIYMVNASLEGVVIESTRKAMTGELPETYETRKAYIESIILSALETAGITEGISISTKVYDSFSNIGEPEPYVDSNGNGGYDPEECFTDVNNNLVWDEDMGSTGLGGEENIMVMKVNITLPYMTGFMTAMMGGDTGVELSSTTAIRNEPYGGISWTPSDNVICPT